MLYLTDNITFYRLILAEHNLNKSWLCFEFTAANDFELKGLWKLNDYHQANMLNYCRKQKVSWKNKLHPFLPRKLDVNEYCWPFLQHQVSGPDKHVSHLEYLSPANINPAKLAPSDSHSICPCWNKHRKEKSLSRNTPA